MITILLHGYLKIAQEETSPVEKLNILWLQHKVP